MIRKMAIIGSVLFLTVSVTLWGLSWIWLVEADVYRAASGRRITITHGGGRVSVMISRWTPRREPVGSRFRVWTVADVEETISGLNFMTPLRERPGFEWHSFSYPIRGSTWTGYTVAFPHWLLVLLFAAYPVFAFVRGPCRRRHRRTKGLCLNCAYDLTGNVSGVCPECGEQI